jgi:hypothetical protein
MQIVYDARVELASKNMDGPFHIRTQSQSPREYWR